MHLKKLTPSFYSNNTHLIQALDLKNGVWIRGKERGYGIVVIEINNLMFGIPLRSNIKHKAAYLTKRRNHGETNKGLDFSKAVLLEYRFYVSDFDFKIPPNEHSKLIGKEVFITNRFKKYVDKYISAVKNSDSNILNSKEYRYTTLQNYHNNLDI